MKNLSKKVLSILSTAVLFCGASAIPASAAETDEPTTAAYTQITREKGLIKDFELAKENDIANELEFEMAIKGNELTPIVTTTTAPVKEIVTLQTLPSDVFKPQKTGLTGLRPLRTTTTTTATTTTTTTQTATCKLSYHLNTTSGQLNSSVSQIDMKLIKNSDCSIPEGYSVIYQWYKDGGAISGASSDSHPATRAGSYHCVIKAFRLARGGLVLADSFTTEKCVVTEKFEIKTQPKSGYIYKSGDTYPLSVEVEGGTAPYKYEWTKNGTVVGRNQTYKATSGGTYRCKITDSKGSTLTSNYAYVTENFLRITRQPKDVVICDENGRYISVGVSGGKAPYSYKWYSGNTVIGTTSSVKVTNPGTYYCVITDSLNSRVTTNKVKATINFYSLKQGLPKTYNIENTRTVKDFTVSVQGGTGYYQYVWQVADINSNAWTEFYKSDITTSTSNTRTIYLNAYNKKYQCIIRSMDGNTIASSVRSGVMNVTRPLKVTEVKQYKENGYYYVDFKVEGGYGSYSTTGVYSYLGSNVYRTRAKIVDYYIGSGSTYESGPGWYVRTFYDHYVQNASIVFQVTDAAGNTVNKSEKRQVGSYSVKTDQDVWANF